VFESQQRQEIFLSALEFTESPYLIGNRGSFSGGKVGGESEHEHLYRAMVKKEWSYYLQSPYRISCSVQVKL
jgi:hypothetical protein